MRCIISIAIGVAIHVVVWSEDDENVNDEEEERKTNGVGGCVWRQRKRGEEEEGKSEVVHPLFPFLPSTALIHLGRSLVLFGFVFFLVIFLLFSVLFGFFVFSSSDFSV